ncbi:MAG: hypothetical protein ACLUPF_11525 [Dorea sp.]
MKSLLCVLLTMIISLGSMVTVKADTEIKPYENKENAVLLKREYIDLDEDTVIEIESYEEKKFRLLQELDGKPHQPQRLTG